MSVPCLQTILPSRENTTQLADHEGTHGRFDPYQRASGPVLARVSGGITDRAGSRWHDSTFRHAPGSISALWSAQHDESVELDAALTRYAVGRPQGDKHMTDKKQFTTIDEYISTFPVDTQVILEKMRQAIHKAAPDAVETISYNIP